MTSLVREKQLKQRMIMKMHQLSDNIYWVSSYAYFLMLSVIYIVCLAVFGAVVGKKLNNLLLFLFYSYSLINLQASLMQFTSLQA